VKSSPHEDALESDDTACILNMALLRDEWSYALP
jgi:hypothetical protein